MKNKLVPKLLIAFLLLGLGAAALLYWRAHVQHVVSTNNAYVKTDNIVISAKIGGYVTEVAVRANDPVMARQVLVRIEPADFEAKVEQQEAAYDSQKAALATLVQQRRMQQDVVTQATAALAAARAQADKAAVDRQRDLDIFAKGFATREQVENSRLTAYVARMQAERSTAELSASRAQLGVSDARATLLQADLRQSAALAKVGKLDLSNTRLLSPAQGIVGNKSVEVGQFVRPGMQLLTIVPAGRSYVVANFKETQVAQLQPGQKASLTIDAFPDAALIAVVESIGPSTGSEFSILPPENSIGNFTKIVQRIPVKLMLADADRCSRIIRPGMSVTVSIDTRQATPDGVPTAASAAASTATPACEWVPAIASGQTASPAGH